MKVFLFTIIKSQEFKLLFNINCAFNLYTLVNELLINLKRVIITNKDF